MSDRSSSAVIVMMRTGALTACPPTRRRRSAPRSGCRGRAPPRPRGPCPRRSPGPRRRRGRRRSRSTRGPPGSPARAPPRSPHGAPAAQSRAGRRAPLLSRTSRAGTHRGIGCGARYSPSTDYRSRRGAWGLPPALWAGYFLRTVSIHVVSAFEARHDVEVDQYFAVLLAVCADAVDLHHLAHGAPPALRAGFPAVQRVWIPLDLVTA